MNGASLLQTALALVIVIGLVLLLGWGAQRLGGPRRARELSVLSQVSLGQRERVVVVGWDGQEWMLGVGPGRVNLIAVREASAPAEAPALTPALSSRKGKQGEEASSSPLPLGEGRGEGAVSPQETPPTFPQAFAQQLQQTLTRWSLR